MADFSEHLTTPGVGSASGQTHPAGDFVSLPYREQRRTARHLNLPGFGPAEQQRLHDARVLVVGAGGLGCPAMQSLASAGVGTIVLYDDDTVDVTNLHRQILFSAEDVGRAKVDAATDALQRIQPDIRVEAHRYRLDANNIVEAFRQVDLVIDGSDNFDTKFLVADAAEISGTPLVWTTVLRFAGQISVFNSTASGERGIGLRDLFPEKPSGDSIPDCASAGVLGATTAVMGALAATEAIKWITGVGQPLLGAVLSYDALTARTQSFRIAPDPSRQPVVALSPNDDAAASTTACAVQSPETTPDQAPGSRPAKAPGNAALRELVRTGKAFTVDVREYHETLLAQPSFIGEQGADEHLAMSALADPAGTLDVASPAVAEAFARHESTDAVVYCASGVRSQHFVEKFGQVASEYGITLHNLPGGVRG
ncbi:ThiF family adenylyltransferase [Corynebacterium sp.]|uniref:ThiF family adenylyltransferase n=1 Tax=Corynebacterium sp. TaxID=1720 RepID=UPI002F429166